MHQALYRKYRPRTFKEVCGQKHITDVLSYEAAKGRCSHAYLFCGSRGTGKTSCAKILAKALNCLSPVDGSPCLECDACREIDAGLATDVTELDAASKVRIKLVGKRRKTEISALSAVTAFSALSQTHTAHMRQKKLL